ncbi:MAG: thermopsin family protease [Cuniculiplasma sp.]
MHNKSIVMIVALIMVLMALSPVMGMNFGGSSSATHHKTISVDASKGNSPNSPLTNATSAYYNKTAVLSEIKDKGIDSKYAYLPNMNYRLPVKNGLVQPEYRSYPAPMGLSDFGLNTTKGVLSAYNLTTSSISSSLSLNSADAFYAGNPSFPHGFSAQLNAVLNDVTVKGKSSYVFWTQNVMFYSSRTHQLMFIDNVWNFSSPSMPRGTIYSGNGLANNAFPTFYYDVGPIFTLNSPFKVSLYLNSTVIGGRSTLFFNYSIRSSTVDNSGSYDKVVFNSTYGMPSGYSAPAPHYLISGNTVTPMGLLNDAEFILGGPGGGSTVSMYSLNATMELKYLSASGVYMNVPSAYDYGTDTGETSEGVAVAWSQSGKATLTTGPSLLYGMWNVSSTTQMKWYAGTITPSNSFVFVNPGSVYSMPNASWVPLSIGGKYRFELPSQPYVMNVSLSGYSPKVESLLGSMSISLSRGGYGTYTPLYAMGNSQIPYISYKGSGTVTNQYMLFNGSTGQSSSVYLITNDFGYTVFFGMLIYNVSSYVTAENQTLFTSGTGFGFGVPLPDIIMQSSNFSLLSSVFVVSSLDFSVNPILTASYSCMSSALNVFNSTSVYIGGNYFAGSATDLYLWNGTGNLIWGNKFFNNLSYFSFEGIDMSSSGNMIYNNYFWGMLFDVFAKHFNYNGTFTTNSWNITRESASILHSFNGYEFKGSIIGTSYQGGNYWWNYANETPPFDDNGFIWASKWSSSEPQGDFVPLVANYAHFIEKGLPANMTPFYHIIFNNTYAFSTNHSNEISLNVLNGTYPFTLPVVNEISFRTFTTIAKFIPSPTSGNLSLAGHVVTKEINFTANYIVKFTETGLPTGTEWFVNLSTGSYHTTGSYIDIYLPNASYSYSIASTDKALPVRSGTFTVNGKPQSVAAVFPAKYSLEFIEKGLPTGTQWGITVNKTQYTSTSNSINVKLTNGMYNAQFSSPSGYFPTPSHYPFTVNGGNQSFETYYAHSSEEKFINPIGTIFPAIEKTLPGSVLNTSNHDLSFGSAFDSGKGLLFIPILNENNISKSGIYVYNTTTGEFVKTISTIGEYDAVYNPSTGFVYAISASGNLSEINPSTLEIVKNVSITSPSNGLAFLNQQGNYIYAYISGTGNIVQIDATTLVLTKNIPVGSSADISPFYTVMGGNAYFANTTGDKILILNLTSNTMRKVVLPADYSPLSVIHYFGSKLLIGGENYSNIIYNVSSSAITVGPNISGVATSATYDAISHSLYISSLPYHLNVFGNITEVNPENGNIIAEIPSLPALGIVFVSSMQEIFANNFFVGSISLYSVQHYYTVTFTETGLPAGTTWYVNGTGLDSGPITGSTYSVMLTNGTYAYTIQTNNKIYEPSPSSGSVTVNGGSKSVPITFSQVKYAVTFTETGLPAGTTWYVNGTGMHGHASAPSNISFSLNNGTYAFTVTNLGSYYTTTYSFTVNVSGKKITETVDYYHWAYITGTISPNNATLTINGKAVSISSSGTFNVSVETGTYHVVASLTGYQSYYNNFTLTAGNMKNLSITVEQNSKPSTISTAEIYAIVGAVIAIVVIVGAIMFFRRK